MTDEELLINELMESIQAFYSPTGNDAHRALPEIFTDIQALLTLDNLYLVANGDILINDDIDSEDIANLMAQLPVANADQRESIINRARYIAEEQHDGYALTLIDKALDDYNGEDEESEEDEGDEVVGAGAGVEVIAILPPLAPVENDVELKSIIGGDALPPDA